MSSSTFPNLYYKRLVGTPRACYVCDKPTTTVLATMDTVDFIYTCPTHLTDRNFASQVVDNAPAKPKPSEEEIQKVKREWEEKLKKKQKKEDENKDEKDDKKESKVKSPSPAPAPTSNPLPATHERYGLHRDFFSMRLAEHRKKRQSVQAKELGPRLPGAPTTVLGP